MSQKLEQAGGSGGNGSGVNQEVVEAYAMIPKGILTSAVKAGASLDQYQVPETDRMSTYEALSYTTTIMNAWKVTDDNTKAALLVYMLKYFGLNGSTRRSSHKEEFQVGDKRYSVQTAATILGDNMRKYCRAHDAFFFDMVCGGVKFSASPLAHLSFLETLKTRMSARDYKMAVGSIDFFTPGFLAKNGYDGVEIDEIIRSRSSKFAKSGVMKRLLYEEGSEVNSNATMTVGSSQKQNPNW